MWSTMLFPILPAFLKIITIQFSLIVTASIEYMESSGSIYNYNNHVWNCFHVGAHSFYLYLSPVLFPPVSLSLSLLPPHSLPLSRKSTQFSRLFLSYFRYYFRINLFFQNKSKYLIFPISPFLQVFNIVTCIWIVLYLSAMNEIILSNAFEIWYWTLDKADIPYFVVWHSAVQSVRHNGGTAALGALLITISRIFRLIFIVWRKKHTQPTKNIQDSQLSWYNDIVPLKAYTRNALIMCGIYGKGFYISAESAYQLVSRNTLQCIDTDILAGIVFGFGKVSVAVVMGIAGWIYSQMRFDEVPLTPVFIVIIGSYSIADVFFSVYAIAVDTMVLCAREFN